MARKKKNDDHLAKRVGKNIKAGRIRLGLTQGQLAERIDVEVETVSRIETGAQLPSLARLEEIGFALGLPLPSLLAAPERCEGMAELLAGVLADLPPREREFLFKHLLAYAKHWKEGQAKK